MQPVPESNVLTVSGLNRLAKSLLEGHFPAVRVEGEISNLSRPSSGHWYFTLKDQSAQLRCAMFAGNNRRVQFKADSGQQVTVRGRLSIYDGRGDYQLIVDSMEQAGAGALQRAFELLKTKLEDEGLFRADTKRPLRDDYRHIGLITSATGAAVQDIISVFCRRSPTTTLTLFPVSVQGAQAPQEIVRAIASANRLADKLGIQALIVGRGGGSIEDLQAFNEESVARAIAGSDLAICSAVGHETDFTIADFVADLRAPNAVGCSRAFESKPRGSATAAHCGKSAPAVTYPDPATSVHQTADLAGAKPETPGSPATRTVAAPRQT